MIQREVSRVLVLNLSGKNKRCLRTAQENYALDRARSYRGAPGVSGQRSFKGKLEQPR